MAAIYVKAFLNYETIADLLVPEWVMLAGITVAGALLILIGLSCTVFSIKRMMERKPFLEVNDNGVINRLKIFYTEEVPIVEKSFLRITLCLFGGINYLKGYLDLKRS